MAHAVGWAGIGVIDFDFVALVIGLGGEDKNDGLSPPDIFAFFDGKDLGKPGIHPIEQPAQFFASACGMLDEKMKNFVS